ncbi:hypothetical protein [Aquimarina intermedia]|uniref:Uncharacterized protein n=1 Tax=Aquimarina intermedia TaxID=350814 RepID=A0A5S5CCR1_9FLAO|nr:hypothetical protein [Aquimarina intermedia]TYP76292.1 hypothetical protein BD809_102510 [Aquimarina intermedia]
MKILVYCCFFLFLWACKSQEPSQKIKKPVETNTTPKKPQYSGESQTMDPNTVLVQAKEISFHSNDVLLCGTAYDHTLVVKIEKIEGSGSSLINMISKDQVLTLGVSKVVSEQYQLQRTQENFDILILKLREKPCPDMTTTDYEILSVQF